MYKNILVTDCTEHVRIIVIWSYIGTCKLTWSTVNWYR